MRDLLLASHNPDKLKELSELLTGAEIRLCSLRDFPELEPPEEDQPTLAGNAAKKALCASRQTGRLSLADDTGLFIAALGGEPGIYAARFAGPHCSYQDNRSKVLSLLKGNHHRQAEFRTCAALAAPDGVIALREGILPGLITTEERGSNGFGYDSIFIPAGSDRSYAEMSDAEKNSLSHRARALRAILPVLLDITTSLP